MTIKRVCLFAGPHAGKTTMSSGLFTRFSKLGYSVEGVNELARDWNFEDRPIVCSSDQLTLFAHQKSKEEHRLRKGCQFVVTDCPVLLAVAYSKRYGIIDDVPGMLLSEKTFESKYPSLNIFLDCNRREMKKYSTLGRWQSGIEEAEVMDQFILNELSLQSKEYTRFKFNDEDGIFNFVKEKVDVTNS